MLQYYVVMAIVIFPEYTLKSSYDNEYNLSLPLAQDMYLNISVKDWGLYSISNSFVLISGN